MRRPLLAAIVAALSLLAPAAHATTYWAFTSATGDASGSDSSNCKTLANAIAAAAAGDVIRLRHATGYGALTMTTNASSGSPIRVIGDTLYPNSVQFSGITTKDYHRFYGMRISTSSNVSFGAAGGTGATNDSMVNAVIDGSIVLGVNTSGHVLRNVTATINRFEMKGTLNSAPGCGESSTPITGDHFINCVFTITQSNAPSNAAMGFTKVDGAIFERCKFNVRMASGGGNGLYKVYASNGNSWIDCNFNLQNESPGGDESGFFYIRDNSHSNVWLRDTIDSRGPAYVVWLAASSGTCGETHRNRWDGCLFRNVTPAGASDNSAFWYQTFIIADTIQNCTFITAGGKHPYNMQSSGTVVGDSTVFRHNTIISLGSTASGWSRIELGQPHTYVKDNIFYSPNCLTFSDFGYENPNSTADYNLYYHGGGAGLAVRTGTSAGASVGSSGGMCTTYQAECHSKYGNPAFTSAAGDTGVWTFDWSLTAGSPAINAASDGTNMGAWQGAAAAGPGTYYIDPVNGNDANNGLGPVLAPPNGPWRTISHANPILRSGDKVFLGAGMHTGFPSPDSAGSRPGRITFIGWASNDPLADTTARKQIRIPSGMLTGPYVTIKGVAFDSLRANETADYDSIVTCYGYGSFDWDGDYGVIARCTFDGKRFAVGDIDRSNTADGDLISDCTFRALGGNYQGDRYPQFRIMSTDSLKLYFNTFNATIEPSIVSAPAFRRDSLVTKLLSRGNHWRITDKGTTARTYQQMGASSTSNSFDADSLTLTSASGGGGIWLTANIASSDVTAIATWDSCFFNALETAQPTFAYFQNRMPACTMTYTTIAMNGPALVVPGLVAPWSTNRSTINHCTLVGKALPVTGLTGDVGSVLSFLNPLPLPVFVDSCMTFTNNIVASLTNAGAGLDSLTGLVSWDDPTVDTTGAATGVDRPDKTQNNLLSNNNLYSFYGYGTNRGDRAWLNFRCPSSRSTGAWQPKGGQTGTPTATWWNTDSLSRNGSAGFFDSTATSTFNARLRGSSAAIAAGTGGTDIGAVAYGNSPRADILTGAGNTLTFFLSDPTPDTLWVDVNNHAGNAGVAVQQPIVNDPIANELDFFTGLRPTFAAGFGDEDQLSVGTLRYYVALKSTANVPVGEFPYGTIHFTASDGSGGQATIDLPIRVFVYP